MQLRRSTTQTKIFSKSVVNMADLVRSLFLYFLIRIVLSPAADKTFDVQCLKDRRRWYKCNKKSVSF